MVARLLAGVIEPDEGRIRRHARISFPVGFTGGFELRLSVRQNILHACRIYDASFEQTLEFVARATGLSDELNQPWSKVPSAQRQMFAYALSYAIPFDTYIIDGAVAVGTDEFRQLCIKCFEARRAQAGVILTTRDVRVARRYGRVSAILHDEALWPMDDLDTALDYFNALPSSGGEHSDLFDE